MVGAAEAAVDADVTAPRLDRRLPDGGADRDVAVDDVARLFVQTELPQDEGGGLVALHQVVVGILGLGPGLAVRHEIPLEGGHPLPSEEGGLAAAPQVVHKVQGVLTMLVEGGAGGLVAEVHVGAALAGDAVEGGDLVELPVGGHGNTAVEQEVAVAGLVEGAVIVQEFDVLAQGLAVTEGVGQGINEGLLGIGEGVGIGGVDGGEMAVVEGVGLPVQGDGIVLVVDLVQHQPILHAELGMAADELSLQLEEDDGDGLVSLGQIVHAVFDVVGVVGVAGHEPGGVAVGLLGEADEVAERDTVGVLHDGEGVVLEGGVQHRGHAGGRAGGGTHPDDIVVAPLDIHVVVLAEHIQDAVGVVASVVDVTHHVEAVHRHALDEVAQGHDEGLGLAYLDHRVDDVAVVFLLVMLLARGVEQLVDDVLVVGGQSLPHLGAGVLGGHGTGQIHQTVQGDAVPLGAYDTASPQLLHLLGGVVDKGAEGAAGLLGHGAVEQGVHLLADDSRAVVEDMLKGLGLAVEVAHEMLGALGEVGQGVEVHQGSAGQGDGGVLGGKQAQDLELFFGVGGFGVVHGFLRLCKSGEKKSMSGITGAHTGAPLPSTL